MMTPSIRPFSVFLEELNSEFGRENRHRAHAEHLRGHWIARLSLSVHSQGET